jgi:diguanylate cyclase (GGDEF)-like protein/PAS domain S-box-containing protein
MSARKPFLEDRPANGALRERLNHYRRLVHRQIISLQAEAHYQILLEGLHEGVVFVDSDGRVVTCNPSAERILEFSSAELQGRLAVDSYAFEAVHEDGRPFEDAEHPSRRVLASGEPCLEVVQGLVRNGRVFRWLLINAVPLVEISGRRGAAVSMIDITQAKLLEERLRHEAIRDELTGLYNRRYLMDQISRTQNAARRHGHGMCLCICDLDHFKDINDTYGHIIGDIAICAFGQLLASHIRQEDLVARFGGDEFCILFTHSRAEQACVVLERIRQSVEEFRLPLPNGEMSGFTASFGVAEHREEIMPPGQLLEAADQALYRAKGEGRNRVVRA